MVNPNKPKVKDILAKYGKKIEGQIDSSVGESPNYSREYSQFKDEMAPEFSRYERWCHSLGNFIKIKVSEKDKAEIKKWVDIAHLEIEESQAITLALMTFLGIFLLGIILSLSVMFINAQENLFDGFPFLFFVMSLIIASFLFYYTKGIPQRLGNKWRLKASSQMVPAILYIVVYMRHTPNLEKAIAFAAQHLEPPLALDLRKVFYNVQIGKFSTIKESLDNYLMSWRDYSPAFIESFHLIESSLFEPSEGRRIATLEKSLQVVLDGVYDQMLKFVHEVKSPIQNTYMLGTTLPILGIALLPLASALLSGLIKTNHVFLLYNLIIPFIAFFLMNKYLLMRPGGYGETSLLEKNPAYPNYISKKHYTRAFLICLPFFILGLLPLIVQYTPVMELMNLPKDFSFTDIGLGFLGDDDFFGFRENNGITTGPFGIGSVFLGMFFSIGVAMFFSIAYIGKTKELIKEREKTKELESEFNNSLFQLGNRIGNGTPPELVFGKVAESTRGLKTEDFFKRVNYNVRQMGMSVEKAIFDSNRGAIIYYPSNLIATSMRILVESSKKGLNIAAVSLMSISEYVKNIQKITARLRDILAEVVSDMKSNMTFLAPLLSGVVVGLASMIVVILSKLDSLLDLEMAGETSNMAGISDIVGENGIFQVAHLIPPYYLQIAIAVYLIQIIFILTSTLITIDSGEDKLSETNQIAKNLKASIFMYLATAFISTFLLYILASVVLGGL